ncbi:MAG: ribonuclease Z [Candidatus Marinimicrobia bacterium]|nr:ribonuclease Z [Candidatus Neomarinimicrobiota bacterium]
MKLTILGTASQLPTRTRNQNGYLFEWFEEGILFDPGEGTQRQFIHAGISPGKVHRIFISHFHGDHCLGLPGMMQRLSLMEVPQTVSICYPAEGEEYFRSLCRSSKYTQRIEFEARPLKEGLVEETERYRIEAYALKHSTPVLGYRFIRKPQLRFDRTKLEAAGLKGPVVGKLEAQGSVSCRGKHFTRQELSYRTPEKVFAYALDTGKCENITPLIRNADGLLMEATYLDSGEQALAEKVMHMTAEQAAVYARDNGVKQLILTHYSERYKDPAIYEKAVEKIFKNTHIAHDFDVLNIT